MASVDAEKGNSSKGDVRSSLDKPSVGDDDSKTEGALELTIDPVAEKRLLWKMDAILVPLCTIICEWPGTPCWSHLTRPLRYAQLLGSVRLSTSDSTALTTHLFIQDRSRKCSCCRSRERPWDVTIWSQYHTFPLLCRGMYSLCLDGLPGGCWLNPTRSTSWLIPLQTWLWGRLAPSGCPSSFCHLEWWPSARPGCGRVPICMWAESSWVSLRAACWYVNIVYPLPFLRN